jgi:hypothetical protein
LEIKAILEAQGWRMERESGTAFFYNFAPWIAPKAYLHIVFREAATDALGEIGDLLDIPQSWRDTLSRQNGAILFSGALSVYGVHASGTLLNRKDVFERLPFSILDENRSWPTKDQGRYFVIGGYGYDGTRVVMDRVDGSVVAMPRKTETCLRRWPDADSWLREELSRLLKLFDKDGKICVSEEETLPHRIQ